MTISLNGSTGIVTPEVEGRVIDENGFQVFGGDPENRIINGAFDFWQRGTSSTANVYLADRWRQFASGGTVTQSRQSHTVGDKFGVNSPQFYLRQTVSGQSAAGHSASFFQPIEDVRSYAGETITVLGWARRSSGSGNMAMDAAQFFGTGGSPSATTFFSPTSIALTTSWEPFAAVLAVPSISGKTIGSDGNHYFGITFFTSAGSDADARTNGLGIQTIGVDLWGIHIKRGTHTAAAAEFYKAPELGPELARCERYYWRGLPATSLNFPSFSASSATASWIVNFPTTMRGTPTLASDFTGATLGSCTGPSWSVATANGGRFGLASTAVATNAFIVFAASNFLAADAEL